MRNVEMVQTNKVRCSRPPTPAPWVLGLAGLREDWSGGFGTCAGVQPTAILLLQACLSPVALCAHSPPMGAFQKQGSKLQESMGALAVWVGGGLL